MPHTPADQNFVEILNADLPSDTIRPSEARYLTEPRARWQGVSQYVALPRDVSDVAKIVGHCARAGVALIPYGGGTGLVGGQISEATPAPLIVSLERMTQVRGVYPQENTMIVEAGAILADVQAVAQDHNRLFPLSLASEGSARIGGLLSTNAGGVNTLRYGNARDQVLGLEVVLPDGQIWHGLKRLRKDNTGYDLRNLMIGAEGTLGIITAAALKLAPRPAVQATALLTVASPEAALHLLALARDQTGDAVSAFELLHRMGFAFLQDTLPDIRQPWAQAPEWSVLIELGMGQGQNPELALETMFEAAVDAGWVSDGIIAQSQSQSQDFWNLREHIPEANRRVGAISSHDISVPLSAIPDFIRTANETLANEGNWRINCFGHVGDGNLHYNVFPVQGESRDAYRDKRDIIKSIVHDITHSFGGSVSAEHGIGRLKVSDLELYGDPAKLSAMRAIKSALDPSGIMNPGAILRGD